jgi:hypothetical protein
MKKGAAGMPATPFFIGKYGGIAPLFPKIPVDKAV